MARKIYFLPDSTEIEVIAIRGKEVFKKLTHFSEIKNIKKKKGWKYYFYQKGFSQFN